MDFLYDFTVGFKDGTTEDNKYVLPKDLHKVAYIHFVPKNALCPPFFFFFTNETFKLEKFYGKGFITTGRGSDYYYCLFTDKFRCYINAYEGNVIFTDDLTYMVKSRHTR